MPEEINRILTDQIADLLFTTEREANRNLRCEGIPDQKMFFVGNVMIDTLLQHKARALAADVLGPLGIESGTYALLTLHRPSNVDVPETLNGILDALGKIQGSVPILFPIHPRTRNRIREFGFQERVDAMPKLHQMEPKGYIEFLNLMANARLVLTDSGGIQEETTILGVPCLTLRENTERPVTITEGTNRLVGSDPDKIVAGLETVLSGQTQSPPRPELWDGQAARRIRQIVARLQINSIDFKTTSKLGIE